MKPSKNDAPIAIIGSGSWGTALAFKFSLVPFHSWTPDVYQGAPTAVTGFMSVATKAAAFALIARMFFVAFPELNDIWMPILFRGARGHDNAQVIW